MPLPRALSRLHYGDRRGEQRGEFLKDFTVDPPQWFLYIPQMGTEYMEEAGFLEIADANNIVILFPQVPAQRPVTEEQYMYAKKTPLSRIVL